MTSTTQIFISPDAKPYDRLNNPESIIVRDTFENIRSMCDELRERGINFDAGNFSDWQGETITVSELLETL